MSTSAIYTLVATDVGIVTVHHKAYSGSIYDDDCIWHNVVGPAVMRPDGRVFWYLNDILYATFDEWVEQVDLTDEEIFLLKMTYL